MNNETLKHVLVTECDGLVGALCVSIDDLKTQCLNNIEPTRANLLQYCLSNNSMLVFPNNSNVTDTIAGGIDYYLDNGLAINQHIDRFVIPNGNNDNPVVIHIEP
ncbi:hypothetical protein BDEG_28608 [Batrachochytrium dendrobatidis JEL423]|uniref:Uncharacterized protein n=1 Tax=Batrachochytrium dendrobatidis (strain JEL423) TaxID=403673 RepID=A0A177WZF4_BATDL|nr:hypothetical protein BDEG_28608 [Batrachochytrium dendrobatidis JEL423]